MDLGAENCGFLRDFSEGGLAITTLVPIEGEGPTEIRFRLDDNTPIEVKCHLAWTDENGTEVGIKCVGWPDKSYHLMRGWLSPGLPVGTLSKDVAHRVWPITGPERGAFARPALAVPEQLAPVGAGQWEMVPAGPLASIPSRLRSVALPKRRRILGPVEIFFLLSTVFFTGGYFYSRHAQFERAPQSRAGDVEPGSASPSSNAGRTFVPAGSIVLELGTFKREEDALALGQTLQQNQFPAFVLAANGQHVYRVLMGPYPDVESAEESRRALARSGFKAIVKQ